MLPSWSAKKPFIWGIPDNHVHQCGGLSASVVDQRMRTTLTPASRRVGAIAATLIGGAFFFAIIGVFGLWDAIGALALFVVIALLIFRHPQAEEMGP